MKKNFGKKNWMFPMPVLMIGTYNYDPCAHVYRIMGEEVAKAFRAGKRYVKQIRNQNGNRKGSGSCGSR